MARNPSPAIQGELDGLCGVYSIVNAIQWVLHTGSTTSAFRRGCKPLTRLERQALFNMLVTALDTPRPLAKFVTVGIGSPELARLLEITF